MRWSTVVMLAACAPALPSAAGAAQEEQEMHEHERGTGSAGRPEAGPPGARPEIENEAVAVVRIRLAPHQKIPMHRVTARVVIYLTDAHLLLTFPDGSSREQRRKAGDTEWLETQVHAGENVGDGPLEMVAVLPRR